MWSTSLTVAWLCLAIVDARSDWGWVWSGYHTLLILKLWLRKVMLIWNVVLAKDALNPFDVIVLQAQNNYTPDRCLNCNKTNDTHILARLQWSMFRRQWQTQTCGRDTIRYCCNYNKLFDFKDSSIHVCNYFVITSLGSNLYSIISMWHASIHESAYKLRARCTGHCMQMCGAMTAWVIQGYSGERRDGWLVWRHVIIWTSKLLCLTCWEWNIRLCREKAALLL